MDPHLFSFFPPLHFFLAKDSQGFFKELLRGPHQQAFKHSVHKGAEFEMRNANLAGACRLRDAIGLSVKAVFVG